MNLIVIAICVAGIQSGDFVCHDTSLVSRAYVDCVDDHTSPPIGAPERGSGFIRWGSRFGDEFASDGSALYEWSGWQAAGREGPTIYVRAVIGVDENRIFADDNERECRSGWF